MKNIVLVLLLFLTFCGPSLLRGETNRPNVLFIAVDDLRTELGCYGHKQIHTPNIDSLAAGAVVFEKAYCMVSVCGASRASLLTGLRPKPRRFVGAHLRASKDAPDAIPLNTHFKNHGYTTMNNGKIFHFKDDHDDGWSVPAWRPSVSHYALQESKDMLQASREAVGDGNARGPAWECADVPDDFFADGATLNKSVKDLRTLAEAKKPFFFAVGFLKPHLPFVAPKKYWDLYKEEEIRLPENFGRIPADAPKEAIHQFGELRRYGHIPKEGPVPEETARKLIHGYYACVSYTDALVGRLLDELDALGLAENTAVVFWGDHGWLLGEHTMWCKHSVFDNAMHAPLIIRFPGRKNAERFDRPVEFLDIYPTLCDLAGLPEPQKNQLQGKSLLPLLDQDPGTKPLYAAGRYVEGDTITDGRYRYSEFRADRGAGEQVSRMLFDHRTDARENVNVAELPENASQIERLSKEMHRTMRLP